MALVVAHVRDEVRPPVQPAEVVGKRKVVQHLTGFAIRRVAQLVAERAISAVRITVMTPEERVCRIKHTRVGVIVQYAPAHTLVDHLHCAFQVLLKHPPCSAPHACA